MSKQLGNSPDPLQLIEEYGADGVRVGIMLSAPAGNDIFFDKKLCETGRNFCNKIWNAFRPVKGWEVSESAGRPEASRLASQWMRSRLDASIAEINDLMAKFRISEALKEVYRLFWDEFSAWYLEAVKPAYGSPVDRQTLSDTLGFFDELLRLLHPFMPFITEELWQHISDRRPGESIMYAPTPAAGTPDASILTLMETVKEAVNGVRNVRAVKNLPNKQALALNLLGTWDERADALCVKLANLSEVNHNAAKDAAAASFMVGTLEVNVPLADNIDVEAEIAKLSKDADYLEGFKASVLKKLSNERFVSNAPAQVVEAERRKLADAESKLNSLHAAIAALRK